MKDLLPGAEKLAARLKERRETVAVAESSRAVSSRRRSSRSRARPRTFSAAPSSIRMWHGACSWIFRTRRSRGSDRRRRRTPDSSRARYASASAPRGVSPRRARQDRRATATGTQRTCLPRRRWPGRGRHHGANRRRGPPRQHASLRRSRP